VIDEHDELTIGAVAERTGTAVSALRFYEERGLIRANRSPAGHRMFPRHVLRRVAFIQVAQRVGLNLDEIGDALDTLPGDTAPTPEQWHELSSSWRPLLDGRIRLMERLRDQLDGCIGCGCLSLEKGALRNPNDRAAGFGPGPRYLMGDESS
jgi:MerR family redox-sensitive transcriptional activator SoxR